MFERFTDRARRVLVLAQEEARLLNHPFIGTEHLLLGLIHEGDGVAAKALERLGISLDVVREAVEGITGVFENPPGSPPFTERAKKVLELSLREALELGHDYIGTEHILLGIAREGEGVAVQVLSSLGADTTRVRHTVIELLGGSQGTEGTEAPKWEEGFSRHRTGNPGCSFCGRTPPDSGQLFTGANASICEHCVRRWSQQMGDDEGPDGS
jgi:ATP-dependent Clp protease ATP-binding subunit ClpC